MARMYPDQIEPKVVIEHSDLPKKERILREIKPSTEETDIDQRIATSQKKKTRMSKDQVTKKL